MLAGASFLRDPYQFAIDGPRPNLPNMFLPAALLFVPLSALGPGSPTTRSSSCPSRSRAWRPRSSRGATASRGPERPWPGVVFACMPYRVGVLLGGHPAGLAYPLVPLVLWGLEGALAGSVWGGLAAGGALLGLAMMEPHFAYFAALGLPLYALARLGLPAWRRELLAIGGASWLLAASAPWRPPTARSGRLPAGWQPPLSVRLAVGAVVALTALGVWRPLAAWLLRGRRGGGPRAAARRSLLACAPWALTAAAATGRSGRLVAAALALPLVLHGAWVVAHWRRWWHPRLPALPVALAAAGALAGAGFLLLLQRLLLRRSVSGAGRSLFEVLLFSPSPADLFTRVNLTAGRAVYPGVVALGLAGVRRRRARAAAAHRRAARPVGVPGLARGRGDRVARSPAGGLPAVRGRVPPGPVVELHPPAAKAQILVALALAVLAGVGADALLRRGGRVLRGALAVALGLLVALEYHPWRPAGLSGLPAGGEALDTSRVEGPRALWIPLWPGDSAYSGLYLYATTLTRVPMLNGYSAWLDRSYLPEVYHPLEAVNLGVVGEAEARVLRRYRRAPGDPRPACVSAQGERVRPGAHARSPPGLALSRPRRDPGRGLGAAPVPGPGDAAAGPFGAAAHQPARRLLGG